MNEVIIIGFVAMIVAQVVKIPIYYLKENKLDYKIAFSTGSMPSSHSAVVVATALQVGLIEGYDSAVFGVAFVLMGITIHDAVKVRGESGKQATVINTINKNVQMIMQIIDIKNTEEERNKNLKELIGHTASEVLGGILTGIILFIIMNYFIFK